MQEGFWYHHAEATYLMLVYWIPQTPHTIPSNASHRVGIGALVINDNGEVCITTYLRSQNYIHTCQHQISLCTHINIIT